eukprot:7376446-Prymnesium_polylepis.1
MKIVPQSSAEAEAVVYSYCCRELKFISHILEDWQFPVVKPLILYCDNSAAITFVKDVGSKARTRHFDRWIHFGREQYIDNFSTPKWVPTTIQVADIFTKPLDKTTFSSNFVQLFSTRLTMLTRKRCAS